MASTLAAALRRCTTTDEAAAVHDLRVVLRRLRLHLRAGRPLVVPATVAAFRRWASGLSHASGPVRDYDVALEWLEANAGGPVALGRLQARRRLVWRALRRRLTPPPPALAAGFRSVGRERRAGERLRKRVAKLEARFRLAVQTALPRLVRLPPEAQHDLRRQVRRWRYLREFALPAGQSKSDPLLRRLVRLQTALGEQQDRAGVLRALGRVQGVPRVARLRREARDQRAAARRAIARAARPFLRPGPR